MKNLIFISQNQKLVNLNQVFRTFQRSNCDKPNFHTSKPKVSRSKPKYKSYNKKFFTVLLVHDFKKGSKIFEISDFGTWTSRYTILKTAQNHYVLIDSLPHELRQCVHSTHVLTQTDHHIFHIWMVSFLHELMQYANSNHISNQNKLHIWMVFNLSWPY